MSEEKAALHTVICPLEGKSTVMVGATPASAPWPDNSSSGRSPFGSLSSSLGKKLGASAENLMAMAAEAERED